MTAISPDVGLVPRASRPVRDWISHPPGEYAPRHAMVEEPRRSLVRLFAARRALPAAAPSTPTKSLAASRIGKLGAEWQVLAAKDLVEDSGLDFITVGPGGIFAVSIHKHGRHKVMFAGETVQVQGRRPPLVRQVRAGAQLISRGLSRMTGTSLPVIPVLAFQGTGPLVFYGVPKGCVVTAHRELPKVLRSRGNRISGTTVAKIVAVASYPPTWQRALEAA